MSWESLDKASEKGPMAVFWWLLPKLIVIGVVMSLIGGCVAVVSFGLNPLKQAASVVNKTVDADNMIYNYEWFKQRYQDVLAIDSKIELSKRSVDTFKNEAGDRKEWDRNDKEEHSRLASILLGLEQQREDLVAEYNARSKMANRSIFKTGDQELPEEIQ